MSALLGGYKLIGCNEAAGTAYNTSTTETSLVNSTITVPAGALADGSIIRVTVAGNLGITGTPNWTLAIYMGAGLQVSTGANAMAAATGFVAVATGVVRTTGATGTIAWSLKVDANDTSGAQKAISDTSAVTVALTTALAVDAKGTWSASSASNTCTVQQFAVEVFGS